MMSSMNNKPDKTNGIEHETRVRASLFHDGGLCLFSYA